MNFNNHIKQELISVYIFQRQRTPYYSEERVIDLQSYTNRTGL